MRNRIVLMLLLTVTVFIVSCAPNDYLVTSLFEMSTASAKWDDSAADVFLPSAVVGMRCSQDPAENRTKMQDTITQIKAEHADVRLIVFGETVLGWYITPDGPAAYQKQIAEPVDGTTMTLMKSLALSNDTYIGYGYTENDGGTIYNSFALIDDTGALIANHRKTFMAPDMDDVAGFTAGKGMTTAYVDGIKVGIQICYDSSSVSLTESYAKDHDIKIMLVSIADEVNETPVHGTDRIMSKWMLYANRYGKEGEFDYTGYIGFYDPAGCPRKISSGSEGYLFMKVGVEL